MQPSGKNITVAVLSYADITKKPANLTAAQWRYVIKSINLTKIKSDIQKAREQYHAQIVIVMMHWGTEYKREAGPDQLKLADFLFRNGYLGPGMGGKIIILPDQCFFYASTFCKTIA